MKAHLVTSADPLKENLELTALCGANVPQARFVFQFDLEIGPRPTFSLSTLLFCRKCAEHRDFERYVYGIVEGQKAMEEVA